MTMRITLTATMTAGLFTLISSCGTAPPGGSTCPLPWPSLGVFFEATDDVTVLRGTGADPTPADQNLGADTQLVLDAGTAASGQQHVLIRFDNLSLVPACALVAEARLRLTPLSASVPFDRVAVYQITTPWTEGTGTPGTPVPPADGATWHTFDGTTLWSYLPAPPARPDNGGCFDPACANTAVDLAITLATEGLAPPAVDILLDKGVVQGWINGTVPNNGLLVRFTPGTIAGTRLTVGSGEQAAMNSRAQLAIVFTPQ